MENNTKSLTDSILDMTKNTKTDISQVANKTTSVVSSSLSSANEGTSGFFDWLKKINIFTWIIIIIVLAFLGFNIFTYLSKGTNEITSIFQPIFQKLFGTAVGTSSQTIDVAAEGGKAVVTGTSTGVNTGLTAVQNVTPNNASSSIPSNSVENKQEIEEAENSLNKTLNSSNYQTNSNYQPNEAPSSVNTSGKAGWCYIGEDRGFRTCAKVGVNDKCMSGDIFPSQDLCINPNLRE
jgi:hypothetical protein